MAAYHIILPSRLKKRIQKALFCTKPTVADLGSVIVDQSIAVFNEDFLSSVAPDLYQLWPRSQTLVMSHQEQQRPYLPG